MKLIEGSTVLIDTQQAGTICQIDGGTAEVLLVNGDIWRGAFHSLTPADLEMGLAAPLNVDRFTDREKAAKDKKVKTSNSKKNTAWTKDYENDDEE